MKTCVYVPPICEMEFFAAEDVITTSLARGGSLDLDASDFSQTIDWKSWTRSVS